ncbi:hypothetical protein PENTCL1PPCAC_13214, partial [Pristionchus entomophagus]
FSTLTGAEASSLRIDNLAFSPSSKISCSALIISSFGSDGDEGMGKFSIGGPNADSSKCEETSFSKHMRSCGSSFGSF